MDPLVIRWLLLAAIFIGAEMVIRTYYLFGFATGGLAGAVSANLAFPFWGQWIIFIFVALTFVIFTRIIKRSFA